MTRMPRKRLIAALFASYLLCVTFAPLFAALRKNGYRGDVAVEPFDYVPDGPAAAARAIGYIRGIIEASE